MTDYVRIAEAHGAKFDQANGMWRILDQPGTVLWWAYFLDQRTAACAYCIHHRLPNKTPVPSDSEREIVRLRLALEPFALKALTRSAKDAPDETTVQVTLAECRTAQRTLAAD